MSVWRRRQPGRKFPIDRRNGHGISFLSHRSHSIRRIFRYGVVPFWKRYAHGCRIECRPVASIRPSASVRGRSAAGRAHRRRTCPPRSSGGAPGYPGPCRSWTRGVFHKSRHRGPGHPACHRRDGGTGRRVHPRHGPAFPRDARDAGGQRKPLRRAHSRAGTRCRGAGGAGGARRPVRLPHLGREPQGLLRGAQGRALCNAHSPAPPAG